MGQTDKQTGRREEESIPSERGDFCVRNGRRYDRFPEVNRKYCFHWVLFVE